MLVKVGWREKTGLVSCFTKTGGLVGIGGAEGWIGVAADELGVPETWPWRFRWGGNWLVPELWFWFTHSKTVDFQNKGKFILKESHSKLKFLPTIFWTLCCTEILWSKLGFNILDFLKNNFAITSRIQKSTETYWIKSSKESKLETD